MTKERRMPNDEPRSIRLRSVLVASAIGVAVSSGARAEDWPSWRGPRGDGTWQAPKLPDRWPAGGPSRLWSQPIGGGFAGLSVVGNRLYTLDREAKTSGADADGLERIRCVNTSDGRPVWEHAYQ